MTPLLLGAALLGLLGSVHCLAMCGGIAGALGQLHPASSVAQVWSRAALYSGGRITSYAIAGALVGALGEAFTEQTGQIVLLRVLAGLLIAMLGVYVAGWWNGLVWIERMGLVLWRRVAPLRKRIGRPDAAWQGFALGMVWGWLPCGLVYSALVGAAATGRVESGAAFMLCFGVGTLPALLPASALADRVGRILADRSARRASGALLIVFGLWSMGGAVMAHSGHEAGSEASPHGAGHVHSVSVKAPSSGAPSGATTAELAARVPSPSYPWRWDESQE